MHEPLIASDRSLSRALEKPAPASHRPGRKVRGSKAAQGMPPIFLSFLASCFGFAPPIGKAASLTASNLYCRALAVGLRQEVSTPLGELLAGAVVYCRQKALDQEQIKKLVGLDSCAVLGSLFHDSTDGATMVLIRSAMIGSALLGDEHAVAQWAQEGLNRCVRVGGEWPATAKEWKWVTGNAGTYTHHIQELRRFFIRD